MEERGEEEKEKQNRNENREARSCKGYLYYNSVLKSQNHNPRCIGIPRSLPQVRGYVAGKSEAEATKEGRSIIDFYYACAGYSVYMSGNKDSVSKEEPKPQLPVCIGVELLVNRKSTTADTASAPAHVHSREDPEIRKPQTQKPTHAEGDDFLSRFTRNANVVASGVAKNMRRVGNYIKETVDDILLPYRRRPK